MVEAETSSEELRREAEELRKAARRLIKEAAWLFGKSERLEQQISESDRAIETRNFVPD